MYYLYYIVSEKTDYIYIGITNNIKRRFASHKHFANKNKKSPLYDCMRKHGVDNFIIVLKNTYTTLKECQEAEIKEISDCRDKKFKILNVADGGQCGYIVPKENRESWIAKLKIARQCRKPSLGMKHTEENKKFFSECNKRKVLTYPNIDFSLGFTKNNKLLGISKTHYYRLLKRSNSNEIT
jgi:predicted GIY-YIG superfamily endonuclease